MASVNMFWNTVYWIVDTISLLYFLIVIIVAILALSPVIPYHPTARMILRFFRQITDPVFKFFRRRFRLYRYASPFITPLVVILTVYALRIFLLRTVQVVAIATTPVAILRYLGIALFFAVLYTIYVALGVYLWIIVISVILSWIPLHPSHPVAVTVTHLLAGLTEPVFSYFRKTFRLYLYTAPLDFTPMIVILVIYLLRNLIIQYLMSLLGPV